MHRHRFESSWDWEMCRPPFSYVLYRRQTNRSPSRPATGRTSGVLRQPRVTYAAWCRALLPRSTFAAPTSQDAPASRPGRLSTPRTPTDGQGPGPPRVPPHRRGAPGNNDRRLPVSQGSQPRMEFASRPPNHFGGFFAARCTYAPARPRISDFSFHVTNPLTAGFVFGYAYTPPPGRVYSGPNGSVSGGRRCGARRDEERGGFRTARHTPIFL